MKCEQAITLCAAAVLAAAGAGAAFGQASAPRPPAAPAAPVAPAPPAAAAAPTPGATDLGDLEVIPGRANMTLFRYGDNTCSESVVRFRIRSKAAGDLKLMLFRQNFSATDANGGMLFKDGVRFVAGGISISDIDPAQRAQAFNSERGKLVSIAPKQLIEVQLTTQPNYWPCLPDPNQDFFRSHRPKTISLATALGVVDVTGNGDVKSISLLDMPLQVGTR